MRWPWSRKPRPVDIRSLVREKESRSLDDGEELDLEEEQPAPAEPLLRRALRDWRELQRSQPDCCWEMLRNKSSIEAILPGDSRPAFRRYLDLRRASGQRYKDEVFLGRAPTEFGGGSLAPIFVPKAVFLRHGYILGGTGSGKTSHALTQILLQLSEPELDEGGKVHRAPILIMDLKAGGDNYLRSFAQLLARLRGQKLRFFSSDGKYESLKYSPLYCLRDIQDPLKMAELWLKALGQVYQPGYGPDFFTARGRVLVLDALKNGIPRTLEGLVGVISRVTSKGFGADGRHVSADLKPLLEAHCVVAGKQPEDTESIVDFDRFFEGEEVLYVHLEIDELSILSKQLGKLLLYSLLHTVNSRKDRGKRAQCFVAIDEFHQLAARNVVDLLTQARGRGVSFLLSHQSPASLTTQDKEDLFALIFQNCSFMQFLTLKDEQALRQLQLIAGRSVEFRRAWSTNHSNTRSWSETTNASNTHGADGMGRATSSSTHGEGIAKGEGSSDGEGRKLTEEMVSALTPELVVKVNATKLLSYVHVDDPGASPLTPIWSVPTLNQGLWPFREKTFQRMERAHWPLVQCESPTKRDAEPVHRKGKDRAPKQTGATEEPKPDDQAVEEIKRRMTGLFGQFQDQAVAEFLTVLQYAQTRQKTVDDVLRDAKRLGIDLQNKDSILLPHHVTKLDGEERPSKGRKKDTEPG